MIKVEFEIDECEGIVDTFTTATNLKKVLVDNGIDVEKIAAELTRPETFVIKYAADARNNPIEYTINTKFFDEYQQVLKAGQPAGMMKFLRKRASIVQNNN